MENSYQSLLNEDREENKEVTFLTRGIREK